MRHNAADQIPLPLRSWCTSLGLLTTHRTYQYCSYESADLTYQASHWAVSGQCLIPCMVHRQAYNHWRKELGRYGPLTQAAVRTFRLIKDWSSAHLPAVYQSLK